VSFRLLGTCAIARLRCNRIGVIDANDASVNSCGWASGRPIARTHLPLYEPLNLLTRCPPPPAPPPTSHARRAQSPPRRRKKFISFLVASRSSVDTRMIHTRAYLEEKPATPLFHLSRSPRLKVPATKGEKDNERCPVIY
jgi:hypothetical protein